MTICLVLFAPDRIRPANIRRFILGREGVHSTGTIRCRGRGHSLLPRLPISCWRFCSWTARCRPPAWLIRRLAWESARSAVLMSGSTEISGSFEQLERSPKRALAMVRCLTDIGLRASEVVQLRLSDIDWRAGTIRLATNKSRRVDLLPLPPETGYAIAEYLRAERPQTTNRALFVRDCAPFDKPIQAGVVRRAVRQAYLRCGLAHSKVHILRHSLASRLLQAGTPLKEIADILSSPQPRYFGDLLPRVDQNRLAAVAMPSPGRSL